MIFVILGMSCVSAVDNGTEVFKEQSNDVLSINDEDNVNLSISDEENGSVGAINENNSTILAVTNDNETLASGNNTDLLTVSSSDSVLTSTVSVKYKTPTKNQRTFNIGGYKAVLSNSQYKKLFLITSIEDIWFDDGDYYTPGTKYRGYDQYDSGLRMTYTIKTNKYVKVKVKIGKKYYTKKTRVLMQFSYGAGQYGVPYKYMISLTHKYANPGYDYCKVLGKTAKYFTKCKCSSNLNKLNKSKLYSETYIYKKYYS